MYNVYCRKYMSIIAYMNRIIWNYCVFSRGIKCHFWKPLLSTLQIIYILPFIIAIVNIHIHNTFSQIQPDYMEHTLTEFNINGKLIIYIWNALIMFTLVTHAYSICILYGYRYLYLNKFIAYIEHTLYSLHTWKWILIWIIAVQSFGFVHFIICTIQVSI